MNGEEDTEICTVIHYLDKCKRRNFQILVEDEQQVLETSFGLVV